jgi:hypothetical protein
MAEYAYLVVYLPRGTSRDARDAARRVLTDHAEYGGWELSRLRSARTAAGRLPSEGESYAQSAHSELISRLGRNRPAAWEPTRLPSEGDAVRPGRRLAAVEEPVQDANSEAEPVDGHPLVDTVEHSGKVQI